MRRRSFLSAIAAVFASFGFGSFAAAKLSQSDREEWHVVFTRVQLKPGILSRHVVGKITYPDASREKAVEFGHVYQDEIWDKWRDHESAFAEVNVGSEIARSGNVVAYEASESWNVSGGSSTRKTYHDCFMAALDKIKAKYPNVVVSMVEIDYGRA